MRRAHAGLQGTEAHGDISCKIRNANPYSMRGGLLRLADAVRLAACWGQNCFLSRSELWKAENISVASGMVLSRTGRWEEAGLGSGKFRFEALSHWS